jgi:hypothetical protein
MSSNYFNYCPRCGISIILKRSGQAVKDNASTSIFASAGGHFAQLHYLVGPPVRVASAPEIDQTNYPKDCEFEIVA